MILLDTNVISELMRAAPDDAVGNWLTHLGDIPLATTAITVSEIAYGLERLADGKRKRDLWEKFETFIGDGGGLTIFPFDEEAALICGQFRVVRENTGQHAHASDMMIAGIAGALGASLATRNVKDFSGLPIQIIDPWAVS